MLFENTTYILTEHEQKSTTTLTVTPNFKGYIIVEMFYYLFFISSPQSENDDHNNVFTLYLGYHYLYILTNIQILTVKQPLTNYLSLLPFLKQIAYPAYLFKLSYMFSLVSSRFT